MINKAFWIFLVMLLLPAVADAQSRAEDFHKADLNGDGFIDAKENESVIQSAFFASKQATMLNRDHDGRIALNEFPGAATP